MKCANASIKAIKSELQMPLKFGSAFLMQAKIKGKKMATAKSKAKEQSESKSKQNTSKAI